MGGFEYLNHLADAKIHAWGNTLEDSLKQSILGVTDLMHTRSESPGSIPEQKVITVVENTLENMVYALIDKIVEMNNFDNLFVQKVNEITFKREEGSCQLQVLLNACRFEANYLEEGEVVKAMTYSELSIKEEAPFDIFFILDL